MLTGKARGILQRLPHFYDADGAGALLLEVVGAAGRSLERAETDLYRVLRAHHVETADNEGAAGYTAPPPRRGALDRILGLYLDVPGGTSQLVRVSPSFTARSVDVRKLAAMLLQPRYAMRAHLESALPRETWELLRRWEVGNARVRPEEVSAAVVLEPLLESTPLAAWVAKQVGPEVRALLAGYGGGEVEAPLRAALAAALNGRVLTESRLYPRSADFFDALPLPAELVRLRAGVHRDFLTARAKDAGGDEERRAKDELEWAETVPTPAGDDLVRLNRLLLEAAWKALPRRGIPSPREVRDALVSGFNRLLSDPALAEPRNLEPELAAELPALRARYAGRPEWLRRILLERSFPSGVESAYAPYRERLLGLIQVLRRGASTRQGIVDVVAANLGLLGDDPEARQARELIEVREYDPRPISFFRGMVRFRGEVAVENANQVATAAEFRLTMRPAPFVELTNVRIVDAGSEEWVEWPGRMRAGDRLQLRGGSALLNGIDAAETLARPVPPLPPGRSRWRFEAEVVVPAAPGRQEAAWPPGRFDTGAAAAFDRAVLAPEEPVVEMEILSEEYHPGTFTVVIPWNIEGFTDRFEAEDHPRQQIRVLLQRVRAAGVEGRVAYLERFREELELRDALRLEVAGRLLAETQESSDAYLAYSRQAAAEDHDTGDALVLAGVFDHTRLDSLNTFA